MAVLSTLKFASASLILLASTVSAATPVYLSPDQGIVLPDSETVTNPLEWTGANAPYFAGPNVNGVTRDVPENCYVEQAAYVVRHGSRYPDNGAYQEWVRLYDKIQAADFEATGELAFLKNWKPVLTHPAQQIAMESPTGYKEAFDLGYRLRTKYPDLYEYGTPFITWTNLYTRVIQTAKNFMHGFLGHLAPDLGTVIVVNSRGGADALFDSLGPSDQCPNFVDGNGGTYAPAWDAIYRPAITARLNALITGNLVLADSDIGIFPYLCGFESQILGILSPFCSTLNNAELKDWQYRQDLRYFYGVGPGSGLPSKMMLPFLNSLVELLAEGPGQNGTANGTTFAIPNLITAFANDGQITELVAATGAFDDQTPLSGTERPETWKYMSSHFVTMRGTVALERWNCIVDGAQPSSSATTLTTQASPTPCSTVLPTASGCNRDNCFRQLLQSSSAVSEFCATYTQSSNGTSSSTALPTFASQCSGSAARVSSACSCIVPATVACSASTATATATATPTPTPSSNNATYIRILLNDAVYPLPSCQDGPGKSCLMSEYKAYVAKKLKDAGDLKSLCNVTLAGTKEKLGGASFFRDLTGTYLDSVSP